MFKSRKGMKCGCVKRGRQGRTLVSNPASAQRLGHDTLRAVTLSLTRHSTSIPDRLCTAWWWCFSKLVFCFHWADFPTHRVLERLPRSLSDLLPVLCYIHIRINLHFITKRELLEAGGTWYIIRGSNRTIILTDCASSDSNIQNLPCDTPSESNRY